MYPRTTDMAEMERRCAPDTWAFYRYWDSKRAQPGKRHPGGTQRRMPARSDLDPLEMVRWLPNIQLVDVSPSPDGVAPRRLVYRLVGEAEIKLHGSNPTGRTVAECGIGQSIAAALTNYDIVIDQRTPLYDWSNIHHPSGFPIAQECILLPLSDDDNTVNMVITFGKVIRGTAVPRHTL